MLWIVLGMLVSFLLGSLPTAYLFGKVLKGIDIRTHGSGNVGATNAWRVLGKKIGITVLAIDILKGLIPVLIVGDWIAPLAAGAIIPNSVLRILLGLACICGHNWTPFLGFRGGKGVATSLGVLIGVSINVSELRIILLFVLATWLLFFLSTRIVSLASIAAALAFPIYEMIFHLPPLLIIVCSVLSVFIIVRHKANIVRLFQGTEKRLEFKKK